MSNQKGKKTSVATDENRYSQVQISNRSMTPQMVDSLHSLMLSSDPMQLLRAMQEAFINASLAEDERMDNDDLDMLALLLRFVTDIEEERFRILQQPTVN